MKPPTKSAKAERAKAERATIVQRLVNGANGVPPVPIVWGISATVQRFSDAMAKAKDRTTYPDVIVDPARVQESGLLKDDIRLDFPAETGQFRTVLLARATRKVKEATDLWRAYAQREGVSEAVVPLLVVQVPNKPSNDLLLSAFETIKETPSPRRRAPQVARPGCVRGRARRRLPPHRIGRPAGRRNSARPRSHRGVRAGGHQGYGGRRGPLLGHNRCGLLR
jgi:hypothetical protein